MLFDVFLLTGRENLYILIFYVVFYYLSHGTHPL